MSGPERNRARRQARAAAKNRTAQQTYELGWQLAYQTVLLWAHVDGPPVFRFPPRDVALLADLSDCGEKLAVNQSARDLLAKLVTDVVGETGQTPTAMMLRTILEEVGHPIQWVDLAELGLNTVAAPGSSS